MLQLADCALSANNPKKITNIGTKNPAKLTQGKTISKAVMIVYSINRNNIINDPLFNILLKWPGSHVHSKGSAQHALGPLEIRNTSRERDVRMILPMNACCISTPLQVSRCVPALVSQHRYQTTWFEVSLR